MDSKISKSRAILVSKDMLWFVLTNSWAFFTKYLTPCVCVFESVPLQFGMAENFRSVESFTQGPFSKTVLD